MEKIRAQEIIKAYEALYSGCGCMQCQHGDPCKGNLEAISEEERASLTVTFEDGMFKAIGDPAEDHWLEFAKWRARQMGGSLSLGGTGVSCRMCDASFAQVLGKDGEEIAQVQTCGCGIVGHCTDE